MVQALLAKGADVNAKRTNDGETALMAASAKGGLDLVTVLLTSGADANAARNDGMTALMAFSQNGNAGVVQALIAKGVDVNAKTNGGMTALMLASYKGDLETVRALLGKGCRGQRRGQQPPNRRWVQRGAGGHADVAAQLVQAGAK